MVQRELYNLVLKHLLQRNNGNGLVNALDAAAENVGRTGLKQDAEGICMEESLEMDEQ